MELSSTLHKTNIASRHPVSG